MELETAKAISKVLGDLEIEHRLYENYSGRFMFGKTTVGIVLEKPDQVIRAAELACLDLNTPSSLIGPLIKIAEGGYSIDSMGKTQAIIY